MGKGCSALMRARVVIAFGVLGASCGGQDATAPAAPAVESTSTNAVATSTAPESVSSTTSPPGSGSCPTAEEVTAAAGTVMVEVAVPTDSVKDGFMCSFTSVAQSIDRWNETWPALSIGFVYQQSLRGESAGWGLPASSVPELGAGVTEYEAPQRCYLAEEKYYEVIVQPGADSEEFDLCGVARGVYPLLDRLR